MRHCLPLLMFVCPVALAAEKKDQYAALFKPTGPVPVFKIDLDKDNLAKLQANPRQYVQATLKVGDRVYAKVGIHIKGAAGSTRDWNDKPALTINMDKFVQGQSFMGLDKFHLNNSVQDPTYLNEIICGEMALAVGLPTARGTHAMVELNGRKVGLYVLKEGYDTTFLSRHFSDATGNLYDGGFLQDIDAPLRLDKGKDVDRKDLKAIIAACQEPNAEKRFEKVAELVDVDRLIANAVLQVVACDWDGYCRNRNNYRLYFDPKSKKAVWFPHGMDQMFQNPGEGLWHGWGGMVARAVLETPEGKKRYIAKMKEFTQKVFVLDKIDKRIDELTPRVVTALEALSKGAGQGYQNEVKAHKDRLKQRAEVIAGEIKNLK